MAAPSSTWDQLLTASQRNDVNLIDYLLRVERVSANHANFLQQSALHVACFWGNVESAERLLEFGANPKARNRISGGTALHCAIQSSKPTVERRAQCARLLLEKDPNVLWISDSYGKTPLNYCQDEYEKDDIDPEGILRTSLLTYVPQHSIFQIIERQNVDEFHKMLSEEQQKQNNNQGTTPDTSTSSTNLPLYRQLDYKSGWTPLLALIDQMVTVDEDDEEGGGQTKNDLDLEKTYRMIQILIQHLQQHEKEIVTNATAATSMSLVINDDSSMTVVSDDQDAQQHQDTTNNDDNDNDMEDDEKRPLFRLYKALYDASSSRTTTDDEQLRLKRKISIWTQTAQLLSANNAKMPTAVTNVMLHDAARRGKLDFIQLICSSSPSLDINCRGRQGMTPLHFAARSGKLEVVRYLCSSLPNIDITIKDDRGLTALDAARVNQKSDVVEILEQKHLTSST